GTVESFLDGLAQPPDNSDWSVFGTLWTAFLRDYVVPALSVASDSIHVVRNVINAINQGIISPEAANIPFLVGIMGCKALWNTIKNLEVGSEVWILSKTKLGEVFPEFDTILAYLTN